MKTDPNRDPESGDRELDRDLRALFAGMAQPAAPASLSKTVDKLPERRRAGFGWLIGRSLRVAMAAGAVVLAVGVAAVVLDLRGTSPAATSAGVPATATATASPSAARTITKQEAVAASEKFLGRLLGQPEVSDPTAWPGGKYFQVMEQGAGAMTWVDIATGNVIYMMLSAPETTLVKFTPAQAQSAAAAFLTAHAVSFTGLTATVALQDHGCCKEYLVTWQRYENGALVPDTRQVGVNPATGTVFSFVDRRVSYGPVPSPVVGRDLAITKAIAASGLSSPTVGEVQLLVDSSPTWPGHLVWSVHLEQQVPVNPGSSLAYVSAFIIYVDATTGETKIAGQG